MSFIVATGLNTFDEEIENTSNYVTQTSWDSSNYTDLVSLDSSNYMSTVSLDSSNYTDIVTLDSSNYTSNVIFDSSNYTSNVSLDSSNYTERNEGELSDRIGFPEALFAPRFPSGVYIPITTQESKIAEVAQIVGVHTGAITAIEGKILGLIGIEGGEVALIDDAIATAGNAYSEANQALNKVDNLILLTTQDKLDTSNYILDTSNVISTRIDKLTGFNLLDYRLIKDSYTNTENDTQNTNTSNVISTRIDNLTGFNWLDYRLIEDSYTKTDNNMQNTNTSNHVRNTSNILQANIKTTLNILDLLLETNNELVSALNAKIQDTSNYVLDTSNVISTRIKNLNNFGKFDYKKIGDPGSAGSLMYDNATGWYIQPELIFNVENVVRENDDPNPGFGVVVQKEFKLVGWEIKNAQWGKLYISTNLQGKPQFTTDISNGAGSGYMVNLLEVDGKTKINGSLSSTSISTGSLSIPNISINSNRHIFFSGSGSPAKITCADIITEYIYIKMHHHLQMEAQVMN